MSDSTPTDRAFVCADCSERWYYTRSRCPNCRSTSFESYPLETGRVLATTVVHATPPDVRSPNRLALVRFDDVTLVAQLGDETIATGDAVEFGDLEALRDDGKTFGARLYPR